MHKYTIIGCEEGNAAKSWKEHFDNLADAAAYIEQRWQGIEYRDSVNSFHPDYATYRLEGFALSDVGRVIYHSDDAFDRTFVFFNRDPKLVTDYIQAKVRARRYDAENSTSWEQEMTGVYARGLPDPERMTSDELKAGVQDAIDSLTGGEGPLSIEVSPQWIDGCYTVMLPVLTMPMPTSCGNGRTPAEAIADLNSQMARDGWGGIYLAAQKP